jgi:hypothetical protein
MKYVNVLTMAAIGLLTTLTLSACAPALVSSWKAPDAAPFRLVGDKVAAVVMATDETTRRAGEDALARQLSLRGAEGIPMYTLLPEAEPAEEAKARAAAEQAGVAGIVVMRPVRVDKEISSNPVTYSGPIHSGFWGGYYGHGWGNPWGGVVSGGEIRTDTIVTVETLVYGLRENKLLWRGQSETTNPRNVNRLIEDTAEQVVNELARLELISGSVRASTG